jgi:pyruvate,water dikinase
MIAWLHDAATASREVSGGKGSCLSRMAACGFPVPRGFVVCADGIDDAIVAAYEELGADVAVAVRSSAVCEDGETASFAGQQDTFLNVRGAAEVVRRVAECRASVFAPRAVFYRSQKGDPADTRMAVVVQEMIRAHKSGVMFTADPVRKTLAHIVIEAVFGLGEGIVSGLITPDQYVINRSDGSLVREFVAPQLTAIVYDEEGGTKEIDLAEEQGAARVLTWRELNCLIALGLRAEQLFGAPQDIEWCIRNNEIFLLQSRPITSL